MAVQDDVQQLYVCDEMLYEQQDVLRVHCDESYDDCVLHVVRDDEEELRV